MPDVTDPNPVQIWRDTACGFNSRILEHGSSKPCLIRCIPSYQHNYNCLMRQ